MRLRRRKADPRDKRVVNQLRRAWSLSDWLISTGLFGLVAQWSLGYPGVFESFSFADIRASGPDALSGTLDFLLREWPGLVLALALYLWFWSYRHHTNNEIEILESLYPEGQSPADWEKVTNRRLVSVIAVGIVAVFMLLAALLKYPALFALIMICMSCQDLMGNEIMRDNLRRILAEHRCDIPDDDPRCRLFESRQAAARRDWLVRPHLRRIILMLILTVVVLAVSLLPVTFSDAFRWTGLPESALMTGIALALAAIILLNEAVMRSWRLARDEELLDAEIAFDAEKAAAAASAAAEGPADDPGPAAA